MTGLLEFFLELFKIFFIGEFGAELFALWLLIRNIVGGPCPSIVAGLHLFKFAENILCLYKVVNHTLVGFFCSHQDSDVACFFVFEKFEFTDSSKLLNFYLSFHSFLHL